METAAATKMTRFPYSPFPAVKPVLLTVFILLSEVLISPESNFLVNAASATSSSSAINHNRLYTDKTLRKKYDPYDDDFLDFSKESVSSNVKRSRGRDDFDSLELERTGEASGRPLSTSINESLIDFRDNTGCPPDFQGLCKCSETPVENLGKRLRYVVNCTNAGLSSTDALASLPQNTEVL